MFDIPQEVLEEIIIEDYSTIDKELSEQYA